MAKGYQIIEPARLGELLSYEKYHEFAVALFHWLIEQLRITIGDQLKNVDIEVIRVTYLGSYPALGVHYHNKDPDDLGPVIISKIDELLDKTPLIELIEFISKNKLSLKELTEKVMHEN